MNGRLSKKLPPLLLIVACAQANALDLSRPEVRAFIDTTSDTHGFDRKELAALLARGAQPHLGSKARKLTI